MTTSASVTAHPTPSPWGLTTREVAALCDADQIVFTYYQGVASIRAIQRKDRTDGAPFPREDLFPDEDKLTGDHSVTVTVQGSVTGYDGYDDNGPMWSHRDAPDVSCMSVVGFSRTDREWQTIARSLTPGDLVSLSWLADNNTGAIRDAGLHADELHLHVEHSNGPVSSYLARSYLVRVLVHRDDSARMIRRYGR